MLEALGSIKDNGKRLKKLVHPSECEYACPKCTEEENSPRRPLDNSDNPSSKANMLGVLRYNENMMRILGSSRRSCTTCQNELVHSSNKVSKKTHLVDLQSTQECPKGNWSKCIKETNALCPHTGPGGYAGKLKTKRGDEVDWTCQKVIKGVKYDGVCTMMEMHTSSKQMHGIKLQGQEILWTSGASWEVSGVIRDTQTMVKARDMMQNEAI